jgi:hypothetical protein
MAIAYDTVSSQAAASTNLTTDLSWSHTCASGATLVVIVATQTGTNINPTSVTYNGSAMTLVATQGNANPNLQLAMYYHATPASGSNTVNVSWSGATVARSGGIALSVTGADSSPAGNNSSNAQATTTPSLNLTTGTGNSWVINGFEVGGSPEEPTATGTNQTRRAHLIVLSNFEMTISTQTTTTAGTYTNSWSKSGSSQSASIAFEIKEAAPTSSIKTINGLTKASVKTVNGLAIASVKTWNGLQ